MSKYVKDLLTGELSQRLGGVQDCVIANVIGLNANSTVTLRKRLREKQIRLLVVKNSLARRATEGSPLAPALEGLDGPAAIVWGCEDFVSLVKEVAELDKSEEYKSFQARGGVMDGEALSADRVREISKWPSRTEQLSILVGQILSPGAKLQSQLLGPGSQLASQIEKAGKTEGKAEASAASEND